jgi:large subunit ribosomal protein L22
MQAIARVRYLKVAPKKMRLVAELVKGKPVEEALNILNYTPRMAAHHLAKTVKSAAANAMSSVGTGKLKAEDLAITKIMVDSAPTAKRVRFQSMGRVFRIRKRYCHLLVEVEGEPEPETTRGKARRTKKARTDEAGDAEKKKVVKGKAKAAVEEAPVTEAVEEPIEDKVEDDVNEEAGADEDAADEKEDK